MPCWAQDNETVLEYLLQRGEALKALAVLRRPGVSQELVYKFAPVRSHGLDVKPSSNPLNPPEQCKL
jgi:hypothetical protein